MLISLTTHGHPSSSCAGRSALEYAKAAVLAGHTIHRVFFYHDAVHLADMNVVTPQDQSALLDEWLAFASETEVELAICIAAGLKRGVINEEDRERYDRAAANVHPAFAVVGLGQLIDAAMVSDRLITFAA